MSNPSNQKNNSNDYWRKETFCIALYLTRETKNPGAENLRYVDAYDIEEYIFAVLDGKYDRIQIVHRKSNIPITFVRMSASKKYIEWGIAGAKPLKLCRNSSGNLVSYTGE